MGVRTGGQAARQTVGSYLDQYVPQVAETPDGDSRVYSRDLNEQPKAETGKVYEGRNLDSPVGETDPYVYNFGTPTSPHELWSSTAHRSASLSNMGGVRSSIDIISNNRYQRDEHELENLPTTKHVPGYH